MKLFFLRSFLGIGLMINLLSCQKEDSQVPIPTPVCLLKSVHLDGKLLRKFNYNAAGQLTQHYYYLNTDSIQYERRDSLIYNELGQIVQIIRYKYQSTAGGTVSFKYSNNGRQVTMIPSAMNWLHDSKKWEFNEAGQLVKSTVQYANPGDIYIDQYEYATNGNVITHIQSISRNGEMHTGSTRISDTYDTQKGPYSASQSLCIYLILAENKIVSRYNNPLVERDLATNGILFGNITYQYRYNHDAYVTNTQYKYGDSDEENYSYRYHCP